MANYFDDATCLIILMMPYLFNYLDDATCLIILMMPFV
jgi:hypothetical protein